MVEAAARCGRTDLAEAAARELAAQAGVARTPLGSGIAARSLALVNEGQAADAYRYAFSKSPVPRAARVRAWLA